MGCCVLLQRHVVGRRAQLDMRLHGGGIMRWVDMAIQEKRKLFRIWKKGGDKEEYLVAKRRTRTRMYLLSLLCVTLAKYCCNLFLYFESVGRQKLRRFLFEASSGFSECTKGRADQLQP